MAYYLVSALPREGRLADLEERLGRGEFRPMKPFGHALSASLRNARRRPDGTAVWEEEDYCRPPLAQERAAVLDDFFDELSVEPVDLGSGWDRIADLPHLFPNLAAS
jgi:hypothetical protein